MRGYKNNIFKNRTFLTLTGVSILAVCGIIGSVMMDTEVESPKPGYIASLDDNGNTETTGFSSENEKPLDEKNYAAIEPESDNSAVSSSDATASDFSKQDKTEETSAVNDALVTNEADGATDVVANGSNISKFSFSKDSVLKWPVDTSDIIIDFSPESTVYFATLDKYKTSNAISIRSEIDTPVYASAAGTVCDIGYNEEIGNSISLNLGNNYELQYGQIKDIQVSEGDTVAAGDLLCYVANPTKYYSVEGPNLYLKLTSQDKAVDPTDYLDY